MTADPAATPDHAIAIIGMAGRFPGAPNVEKFWTNVRDGVESIVHLSDEDLRAAGVPGPMLSDPLYVKACPVLTDLDKFDAGFFGLSPRDASVMDPAQRLFLEIAFAAVEHAGYTGLPDEGKVAVFAGSGAPQYLIENLRTNPALMKSMGDFLVRHTGNDMNFMATRVSYEMDLRGPSINVQTACSSSLVAVHLACQSLLRAECDMALAGGSTILVPAGQGYEYREGEILSPDGHCRPFDEKSAGTVFGSGTGCVVLKRLSTALDDGDTIHAVIRGSAINNDGAVKVGYLAPGVDGQTDCIDAAIKNAGVSVGDISYVETHGTGTLVGDPIEIEGLTQAYRRHSSGTHFCAVGSVKSNIGHLGEAAGIASLIKAVMALKHRQLPPSLGFETPNPQIDFAASPFFVNDKLQPWRSKGSRLCGVTALGAGGTNCHLILEEAPARIPGEGAKTQQLLLLSAKSRTALDRRCQDLAEALSATPDLDLADVSYTLAVGRRPMRHRTVVIATNAHAASALLRSTDPKLRPLQQTDGQSKPVVFLFPGGGAQYAGMGQDLYEQEPVYQEAVDECLAIATAEMGRDLRSLMFPSESEKENATRLLEQPRLALPALFATEYALARLFESWGVTPVAYVGHSMGEYVGACLCGVISLKDALRLVIVRGRLFETIAPGAMLSVALPEIEARALMPTGLDIAAVNAPDLCVASGPLALIIALEADLASRGVDCTRVRINVAAHSSMLDPLLAEFRSFCKSIKFSPPKLPLLSNLTGKYLRDDEAIDPEYWVKHLRNTVRFADCIQTVVADGDRALVEVGPGRTLSTLGRAQAQKISCCLNSMRHPQEAASDLHYALTTLGRLWIHGVDVDFQSFFDGQLRNRIPLPTYPFERTSFWVTPGKTQIAIDTAPGPHKHANPDDWFYTLSWSQSPYLPSPTATPRPTATLFFLDGSWLSERIFRSISGNVIVVRPGEKLEEVKAGQWTIDLSSSNQFGELLEGLSERGPLPGRVLYLIGLESRVERIVHSSGLDDSQARVLRESFFAPAYLCRALGRTGDSFELSFVTSGLAPVDGHSLDPLRATLLGPALVSPREMPQVQTRCIDVAFPKWPGDLVRLKRALVEELLGPHTDRLVSFRRDGRYTRSLNALELPAAPASENWLRDDGVYVLTGGLGGIAVEIATHMARSRPLKLALLSRTALPPEADWDAILAAGEPDAPGNLRLSKIRALRALGAQVLPIDADVTSAKSLGAGLDKVRATFGPITGVIHTAGVMDDEPIGSKTEIAMRRVLAPKVQGTLNLDDLVTEPLDFFVLFSSVASVLGLPGQVDYTAANAFLDAFAQARSREKPEQRTTVVNWNAWRDVGMANTAMKFQAHGVPPTTPCIHPALDGYSDDRDRGRIFSTDFKVDRHWLLSEHKIHGSHSLLPGTAFIELVRAAFAVGRPPGPIVISDLSFLSPFQVDAQHPRRMNLSLVPAGDAFEFEARTAGGDKRSLSHVIGDVAVYDGPHPAPLDLIAIASRCTRSREVFSDGFLKQAFVDFGARWANLVKTHIGNSEALIELKLPDRFVPDLSQFQMHPALLDMATGAAQALIPGFQQDKDFYAPTGYGRILILSPMPQHVFSHIRCRPETGSGLAFFDATLTDLNGVSFALVEHFAMKLLDADSALRSTRTDHAVERVHENTEMKALLRDAIAPTEGIAAFDRLMAWPRLVQVVVSSVDVPAWKRHLDQTESTAHPGSDNDNAPEGFSRPELTCDYVAPSSRSEELLSRVWSDLLGVRQVGVNDDFFDLGGNSLLAVRLFAAVRKTYAVSLPLSTLFEAPTVARLAALLDQRVAPAAAAITGATTDAMAQPQKSGYSSVVSMQAFGKRPPIFCAAGMGGNPLNLRALALLVGLDQPFYGLQPKGLDGESTPDRTVEAMAAHYICEIKQVQPQGPYFIGGYSGGGIVAYEMALQLQTAGDAVGALVLLDSPAPVLPTRTSSERLTRQWEKLQEQGIGYLRRLARDRIHAEADRVVRTVERPLARFFPFRYRMNGVQEAWLEAAAAYRPAAYQGTAMLFRAANPDAMAVGTSVILDNQNGWGPYVKGGIEVSACPGNHNSMCEQPHVRVLARRLRSYLDRRMGDLNLLPKTP